MRVAESRLAKAAHPAGWQRISTVLYLPAIPTIRKNAVGRLGLSVHFGSNDSETPRTGACVPLPARPTASQGSHQTLTKPSQNFPQWVAANIRYSQALPSLAHRAPQAPPLPALDSL